MNIFFIFAYMIVSVQHITKCFAGTKALDDVSFEIPEASIYGLLGPNGAGKTTCIRILNQMIRPDAGEITIDGKPLRESDVERIGYLPEERGLYKKMRVAEQILYFASLKNMDKNHAKQELGSINLKLARGATNESKNYRKVCSKKCNL